MEPPENPRKLTVLDAETEKDFLINALQVWLQAHERPIPNHQELRSSIIYCPAQDEDELTEEDESVSVDGE